MEPLWDYSELAQAYLKRPGYSFDAIESLLHALQLPPSAKICDIGAGTGHLTLEWLKRGFMVHAVEPNPHMRLLGQAETKHYPNVTWFEATAENSGQAELSFDVVSFGSSFNVTDRSLALQETYRILKSNAWFVCMWNHRDLNDPLQARIEAIINHFLPDYQYGVRREDQASLINGSGLFQGVAMLQERFVVTQTSEECLTAWKSHATLIRQAKQKFPQIIKAIEDLLAPYPSLKIPYHTKLWFAQKKG